MSNIIPEGKDLILYDGDCGLCQKSVQWVLKRDTRERFVFTSLQGQIARNIYQDEDLGNYPEKFESLILIQEGRVFLKSSGALRVAQQLKFPYSILVIGLIIPRFVRDRVYDLIAKNRYKWFGESCWLPDHRRSARFLDT